MPKTNAEYCRDYRRKKNKNKIKKTPKTSTERVREFRARRMASLNVKNVCDMHCAYPSVQNNENNHNNDNLKDILNEPVSIADKNTKIESKMDKTDTTIYKDLSKYLPFLDFLMDTTQNETIRSKYGKMKQWIADKRKFSENFFDNMERAIYVIYTKVNSAVGFPQALHKLFAVDLCSDDDDDDDGVQPANTLPPKTTSKITNSNSSHKTIVNTKLIDKSPTTTSDVVLVLSEDDDDIQIVSETKNKSKQNGFKKILPKDTSKNIHSGSNNEIINRITKTVTVIAEEDNDKDIVCPPTPLPLPLAISPTVKDPTRSAALSLDEDEPIFFRRHHLPNRTTPTNPMPYSENIRKDSTLSKKKEKHKKEKKEKRKKKKHEHEKESSTEELEKKDLENMDASLLLEIQQKILKDIEQTSTDKTKPKPIEVELNEKTEEELLAIGQKLIENMGICLANKTDSNFNRSSPDISKSKETPAAVVNQQEIETLELGPDNELVPETSLNNIVESKKTSYRNRQNLKQIRSEKVLLPKPPANSIQTNTHYIPTPPVQLLTSPIYTQHMPPLPERRFPTNPFPLLVPSNTVVISQPYVSSGPSVSSIPKSSTTSSLHSNLLTPLPSLSLSNNPMQSKDPRLRKFGAQGQGPIPSEPLPSLVPLSTVLLPQQCTTSDPSVSSIPNLITTTSLHSNLNYSSQSSVLNSSTQSKDPRLRKLWTQGQYGHNISPGSPSLPNTNALRIQSLNSATPSAVSIQTFPPTFQWMQSNRNFDQINVSIIPHAVIPTTTALAQCRDPQCAQRTGFTQSHETYGSYNEKKRQQEEEVRIQREKEDKLREEEKRLKKIKDNEEAKNREEQEDRRRTEIIREILFKHKDEISNMQGLKDCSVAKKRRQSINVDQRKKDSQIEKLSTSKKIERRKSISSNRTPKELEYSSKGFNTMQDCVPITLDGKRLSSVLARKAIAEELGCSPVKNTKKPETTLPKKRRTKRLSNSSSESSFTSKRQKSIESPTKKILPKMRRCTVRLIKLSESEILKFTRTKNVTKNSTSLIKKPLTAIANGITEIEAKSISNLQTKSTETKPTAVKPPTVVLKNTLEPLVIKNIDCRMTERNSKYCVLCQKLPADLTNHFIFAHKTESYVSRLIWEELDDLQLKVPFAEEVATKSNDNRTQEYKIECPFCPPENSIVTASFPNLRRHYSTHTGEYAYGCKGCGLQKPFRDQIKFHQQHKKCDGSGIRTLYQYPSEQLSINIYLCNICNFVQLNEENVFKHLREQHDQSKKDPRQVKELPIAAIKDGFSMRVPLNTLPNIMQPSLLDKISDGAEVAAKSADVEQVFVTNEPLLDDVVADIIKTEPELHQNIENDLNLDVKDEFAWETRTTTDSIPIVKSLSSTTVIPATANIQSSNSVIETNDTDLKPDISILQQLLHSHEESLQSQNENLETKNQTNDEKPDPEVLLTEAAKALLRKYSVNTGIRPDLLYQCPERTCGGFFSRFSLWLKHMKTKHYAIIAKCPHCLSKSRLAQATELPIEDFEHHLNGHCMKLYFCFHCDVSFSTEKELKKHAEANHVEFSNFRVECIPYNTSYTFHIIIEEKLLPTRLEFLIKLNEVFQARVHRMDSIAEEFSNLNTMWTVANNAHLFEGLQIPVFNPTVSPSSCLIRTCMQNFNTQEELLDHLHAHKIAPMVTPFQCQFCMYKCEEDWKHVFEHVFLHSEQIFICCVCSYKTSYRRNMIKHICEQHDRRDVPLLRLHRSLKETKVELAFVFATGARTFTTTKICFCGCGATNLRTDTFVSHLRREHSLKLRYFCEYCGEHLPHLKLSEEHHQKEHSQLYKQLKIRCQIALSKERMMNIAAIRPLQICFSDEIHELNPQVGSTSILKSILNDCSFIKKEKDAEDIVVMEEDEIIAEDEMKAQNTENEKRPSIRVAQISPNLFRLNF